MTMTNYNSGGAWNITHGPAGNDPIGISECDQAISSQPESSLACVMETGVAQLPPPSETPASAESARRSRDLRIDIAYAVAALVILAATSAFERNARPAAIAQGQSAPATP